MSLSENLQDSEFVQIKTSRYRFVNLVLFILAGLCNSIPTQSFSAIAPIVSDVYEVSELQANINSMIYSFMYPLVVFPVNYILEVYGLKVGTLIGQMFMIIGILIRLLLNINFYFFIAGTFVTGLGFCFMVNAPNKFAINWFPNIEIALINSICIFSVFASDSIGTFSSAIFLDENSQKSDFLDFFIIQSIIIIIILVSMALFFKGKPKNPPNFAAAAPRLEYFSGIRALFKNKNYMKLFTSMTFIFGCLAIFFTSLSWQLKAYGFSSFETGIIFVIANICGCSGCVLFNIIFGSKNYRRNCLIYGLLCLIALALIFLGLEISQLWVIYFGGGMFGLSIFPYLTTITDFASQTAFPIDQAISGGTLLFGGQLFGVIASVISSLFVFDGQSLVKTRAGCGVEYGIMVAGVLFLYLSKQELERAKYQEEKEEKFHESIISSEN